MKLKIFFQLTIVFFVFNIANAVEFKMGTVNMSGSAVIITKHEPVIPPTTCGNCSPPIATTTNKIYKLPKAGVRIKYTDANFSIFPDRINNPMSDRKIFIVSNKWQTACLYDENGDKYIVKKEDIVATTTTQAVVGKPLCIQAATGKKDLPTEIGLYNIQTKYGKDYRSTFYTNEGDKPEKPENGAPMPYAMHFGRIIGQGVDNKLIYDFSDGSAIHEKQTFNKQGALPFVSHGCIAVEKGMGQTLQEIVTYGDLLLVISEKIPTTIQDMIAISN